MFFKFVSIYIYFSCLVCPQSFLWSIVSINFLLLVLGPLNPLGYVSFDDCLIALAYTSYFGVVFYATCSIRMRFLKSHPVMRAWLLCEFVSYQCKVQLLLLRTFVIVCLRWCHFVWHFPGSSHVLISTSADFPDDCGSQWRFDIEAGKDFVFHLNNTHPEWPPSNIFKFQFRSANQQNSSSLLVEAMSSYELIFMYWSCGSCFDYRAFYSICLLRCRGILSHLKRSIPFSVQPRIPVRLGHPAVIRPVAPITVAVCMAFSFPEPTRLFFMFTDLSRSVLGHEYLFFTRQNKCILSIQWTINVF